ncbi:hemolysin family protein [Bacillus massiliigorillae]|uniref:hemolysin family protein n=1 Tax=Bacillus massiliigorillae TaxID=1243664 RepID=UPI0003A4CF87|nr:hemolysin family protein [Bacillus massiliigorillae]
MLLGGGNWTFLVMINILIIILLLAFTAFFVASEFAIVKVRSTRIDQLLAEGNTKAIAAKKVISSLDEYLSACQLGITLTSLGLGWLGEPTVEHMLKPLFESISANEALTTFLSFSIAFTTITFFHVVIGELAPKTLAIQKAEAVTLNFSKPLIWFYRILFPFIWILNHSAAFIIGIFGLKPASEHDMAHSEEELRIILSESLKSGEINSAEYKYVNKIFEFDERIAKEIMVPRTEIVTVNKEHSLQDIMEVVLRERYTRYPVVDGDKDNIVGIINMKEVLSSFIMQDKQIVQSIEPYIHPVIAVIETIPINDLLIALQKNHSHMAILFDEYGGTAGLVTVEDILEEIVGDIRDEFDADELPDIRKISDHHYIFDAKVLIGDVNDLLGTDLLEDEVDTIGGWFLTQKYDVVQGDQIEEDGFVFIVKEIDGQHILFIEAQKKYEEPEPI